MEVTIDKAQFIKQYGKRHDWEVHEKRSLGGISYTHMRTGRWDALVHVTAQRDALQLFQVGESFTGLQVMQKNPKAPSAPTNETFTITSIDFQDGVMELSRFPW